MYLLDYYHGQALKVDFEFGQLYIVAESVEEG